MPKILFIASTASHILQFHLPYLQAFREQGMVVHAAFGGEPAFVPHADETLLLPLKKSMHSPENFRAAAILNKRMQRETYSLVIVHTSLAAFFTRLAMKRLPNPPPLVNMVHGYLFDDQTAFLKRKLLLAAERLTAPQTDLLLTMNRWDFELAQRLRLGRQAAFVPGIGVDFSRFSTMPDGAGTRQKYGIPENAFVLVYAAEFSRRKSQPVLIRAMRELPEQAFLVLAGSGATRAACESLAEELGVAGRVLFPGHQDMRLWYPAADAAVTASRSEGLPFNVMEAMYAGLPVTASRVKGHTDLIEDGQTGLLYPYGDSSACAAQIRRLMDSEALRGRLTEAARESVIPYGLSEVFPIVFEQYLSLIPAWVPV